MTANKNVLWMVVETDSKGRETLRSEWVWFDLREAFKHLEEMEKAHPKKRYSITSYTRGLP